MYEGKLQNQREESAEQFDNSVRNNLEVLPAANQKSGTNTSPGDLADMVFYCPRCMSQKHLTTSPILPQLRIEGFEYLAAGPKLGDDRVLCVVNECPVCNSRYKAKIYLTVGVEFIVDCCPDTGEDGFSAASKPKRNFQTVPAGVRPW